MKILAAALSFCIVLVAPGIAVSGELFLCKNLEMPGPDADSPRQVELITDLNTKSCRLFRPGDRIVAVYIFLPQGTEQMIEFRWKRQFGRNVRIEQTSYQHRIEKASPGNRYLSFAWLNIRPNLLDPALGSKFGGDWTVEVYIDQQQVAEAAFTVH